MNLSRRVVISLLIAAIVLFLGMLFWPFIVNNIIRPVAVALWLLLRILVLSIHQKYIWYLVIFAAFIFLLRFLPDEQSDVPSSASREPNTTVMKIEYWRNLFIYNGQNVREEETLKRELTYLLTSLHASNQSTSDNSVIHDALRKGRDPIAREYTYVSILAGAARIRRTSKHVFSSPFERLPRNGYVSGRDRKKPSISN